MMITNEITNKGIKEVDMVLPRINSINFFEPNRFELSKEFSVCSFKFDIINKKKIFQITHIKKVKNRKFLKDDLFRKIKSNFIHKFLLNLLNKLIIDIYGKNYILLKIDNKIISDISIKYNILLFNKTLGELFDNKISSKYKNNKFNNHDIIKKISKNNLIKKILNYKLKDLYELFISKNWEEKMLDTFHIDLTDHKPNKLCLKIINFYDVLDKDKKNNSENYKKKLINFGTNLFKHLNIINSRKDRKKPELNENNIFELNKIFY